MWKCDPSDDPRFRQYWETYYQLMKRDGATPEMAQGRRARFQHHHRLADGEAGRRRCCMICGLVGTYETHLGASTTSLGHSPDAKTIRGAER